MTTRGSLSFEPRALSAEGSPNQRPAEDSRSESLNPLVFATGWRVG